MRGIQVKQRDITDCGAACLASVSAYYKLFLPVSKLRQLSGTDKKGTSVLGLTKAAEQLGFDVKGAKGKLESLSKIPLPSIAHIVLESGLHHYIVIYKNNGKNLIIMDPSEGRLIEKKIEIFVDEWTGVLVLLTPGENFAPGKHTTSNLRHFWKLIKPQYGTMLFLLAGTALYSVLGLSSSIYVQKVVDSVLPDRNLDLLVNLSMVMLVVLFSQLFIGIFKGRLSLQTGQQIDKRLIIGYYTHLLRLPIQFFDNMRVGEIISRVNDAVKIRAFINDIALNMVVNVMIVAFSISLMFFYYWKLALIILVIVPIYALIFYATNRINKRWQRAIMESNGRLESQLVESLQSIRTIKHFGLEQQASEKTNHYFGHLMRSLYKSNNAGLMLTSMSEFVTRFFSVLILWAGGYFVLSADMSLGALLSFYALTSYFAGPAAALLGANKSVQDALIAADRLYEIIDLEKEEDGTGELWSEEALAGDIVFNDVTFSYGVRSQVFKGLNLQILKGSSTAVVGESGSGKSTLLYLLQRLYPLEEGSITIGGCNINRISAVCLRRLVAVVPQQTELFTGTIIENVAIGESSPNMQRFYLVCKLLGIDELVKDFSEGYNFMLYEQGINLSGGQRQRLAIARALYRDPAILILDEATSSLDSASAAQVRGALKWFQQTGKTVVIIAHRLSAVEHCDNILVFNKGKLVENGKHAELVALNGTYTSLFGLKRNAYE